jgi:Asp-tRNA(Asn)/Glu-tRNA(Gln) amidotransferase C subunit
MKVPLADRVTPYHMYSYEEQIAKKKEQLTEILKSFSRTLENDVMDHREDTFPTWYNNPQLRKELQQPCELSHIIECDEEFRN